MRQPATDRCNPRATQTAPAPRAVETISRADVYRASIARASVTLIQRVDELLVVTWTQPAPATPETVTFSISPELQVIAYRPPALMKLGGAIHTIGWFPTRTS